MKKEYRKATKAFLVTGLAAALGLTSLTGCGTDESSTISQMEELDGRLEVSDAIDKNRTTYEVFVYSFYDSDGDGIGDLKGVEEKLDYIEELGVSQIWLMPICPSDSYHKYDVKDYMDIDPEYGTMDDFDSLVAACHERGITVLTDMVINHSSSNHPWFLSAKEYLSGLSEDEEPDASECPYVDYYNFSREPDTGYASLPGTNWYYEARFTDTMPDLNLDSEALREELTEIASFWLDRHDVDGFRMDATSYYYTGNPDSNIAFMNWYQSMVRSIDPDAYIVGEAWIGQNEYASYYASGFDSYMDFAFASQDGVICKVLRGSTSLDGYVKAQIREQELYGSYSKDYINAPFYTNHDTARSAGYYAGDDGSLTKMAGALNLLMSGNAFVYYGEELGMKGSGKDENKRAPMYWSAESKTEGMCDGPVDMDDVEMKFAALDEQQDDPWSIYNYYKNAIKIRNSFPAIYAGTVTEYIDTDDDGVSVYQKVTGDAEDAVWIAINTSEEEKTVDLTDTDLGESPEIQAVLLTAEGSTAVEGSQLMMPARSIVILK